VIDMRRPLNARITERFTIPIPRPARLQELDKLGNDSDSDSASSKSSKTR